MALIASRALEFVTNILGGSAASEVSGFTLLNQAGLQMQNSRLWNYNLRSTQKLPYRAPVVGAAAVYGYVGTASATITLAGAFASYSYVPGDVVTITLTGGADTVTQVKVLSKNANGNEISVEYDDAVADAASISFDLDVSHVLLPSDFGTHVDLFGTRSFTRYAYSASLSEMIESDTIQLVSTSFLTLYGIEWAQAAEKAQPVATLKVWPEPSQAAWDELSLIYRRGWLEITNEDDVISIPEWMEPLYLQYVRGFAAGYEDGNTPLERLKALDIAIASVESGPIYANAKRRDVSMQPSYGPARHVAIAPSSSGQSISDALGRSQSYGSFFEVPN